MASARLILSDTLLVVVFPSLISIFFAMRKKDWKTGVGMLGIFVLFGVVMVYLIHGLNM